MEVSIIICTRNRAAKLRGCLESLSLLEGPAATDYEIIVVDNRSTDDTEAVVLACSDQLPLRYLYEPKPGLTHSRNRGLAAVNGKYIFFTDDDCVVAPDWLAVGRRFLAENPRQIVGGRVDLYDPTDLPITVKFDDVPMSLSRLSDVLGFLHGCNMIFGRCVIEEIGGFDSLLGPGTRCKAADDTDFYYRAFRNGIPVNYRPELRLAHDHGRKHAAEGAALMDGYRLSAGAFALKHALQGDTALLKLNYWNVRSRDTPQRWRSAQQYAIGALRYAQSLAIERMRRVKAA